MCSCDSPCWERSDHDCELCCNCGVGRTDELLVAEEDENALAIDPTLDKDEESLFAEFDGFEDPLDVLHELNRRTPKPPTRIIKMNANEIGHMGALVRLARRAWYDGAPLSQVQRGSLYFFLEWMEAEFREAIERR